AVGAERREGRPELRVRKTGGELGHGGREGAAAHEEDRAPIDATHLRRLLRQDLEEGLEVQRRVDGGGDLDQTRDPRLRARRTRLESYVRSGDVVGRRESVDRLLEREHTRLLPEGRAPRTPRPPRAVAARLAVKAHRV